MYPPSNERRPGGHRGQPTRGHGGDQWDQAESWAPPERYPAPYRPPENQNSNWAGDWDRDAGYGQGRFATEQWQQAQTNDSDRWDRQQPVPPARELPPGAGPEPVAAERRPQPTRIERRPQDNAQLTLGPDRESGFGGKFSAGHVILVSLFMLLGLTAVGLADLRSRHGGDTLHDVYLLLVGLILIYSPAAARILTRKTVRFERITLVLLLGLALYGVKILASPNAPFLNDEFIHFRNTTDILGSGHLFQYNPLLPTAAYYPGLASITAALVKLTGLSIFTCGLIVVGTGRLVISAFYYLIAERVTGSSRGAGMASLLYAANPMFLFWSGQFAYEDLAMPLVIFAVWWIMRTRHLRDRVIAQTVTVAVIAAIIVTHHISAFGLCGILGALYLAERMLGYPKAESRYLGIFALVVGAFAAFWFFVVAKPAAQYLIGENFEPAFHSMISIVTGQGSHRQPFGGSVAPPKWYELMGLVAILIIMGVLCPAIIRAWRLFRVRGIPSMARRRAAIAVAAIIAIAFPFSLVPRLSSVGGAVSARTSEWLFMGIGIVVGLLMEDIARWSRIGTRKVKSLGFAGGLRTTLAMLMLSAIFIGEVCLGSSFFALLPPQNPEPTIFPAYVDDDMSNAAIWAGQHLGKQQGFASDDLNELALASYGDENTALEDTIYPMFFTASMNSTVVQLIKLNDIHYVLLDWRVTVSSSRQSGGYYYSQWEPDAGLIGGGVPKAYFSKFPAYSCSRLVYHSGPIEIYDVSGIAAGTCVPRLISPAPAKPMPAKKTAQQKATT